MVGKTTPDRGGPRKSPDGVDPKTSGWASKRTRKTQRDVHNSGVKIWSLCSVSSILSHATLQQPFRTLAIKWEVNIFLKKFSCVLHSCVFLPASFILASVIIASVCIQCIYVCNIYWFGACASRVLQGFKTNLVTVNDSFKHHNTTSTKGTKKNAGIERSKKKKREPTNNNKRNRPTRKEQKKNIQEQTDSKRTEKKGQRKMLELKEVKRNKKQEQTSNRKEKRNFYLSLLFKLIIIVKD